MAQRVFCSGPAALRSPTYRLILSSYCKRSIVSSSSSLKESTATTNSSQIQEGHVPSINKGEKASPSTPVVPSSCTPGTVLSGLSLYKDRADPVALPDEDYPKWLWTILDDKSTLSTHSGVTLEATAGLSKGEARAAQKRNLRAVRSAQRGMQNRDSGAALAGAGMKAVGAASDGEVIMPAGEAQLLQGEAAIAVQGVSKKSIEAEIEARKALRRANREKIKSRNFLSKR